VSLVRKVPDGWIGTVTGKLYSPPRECEESAELQERKHAQSQPLRLPPDVKPGSPEEVRMLIQEEALSNIERQDVKDTALAYRQFCARHPEVGIPAKLYIGEATLAF
jgi:hypothetical protein